MKIIVLWLKFNWFVCKGPIRSKLSLVQVMVWVWIGGFSNAVTTSRGLPSTVWIFFYLFVYLFIYLFIIIYLFLPPQGKCE